LHYIRDGLIAIELIERERERERERGRERERERERETGYRQSAAAGKV